MLPQDVRPDRKVQCPRCSEHRSFTLMTSTGECALCLCTCAGEEHVPEALAQDRSCWCASMRASLLNSLWMVRPCRAERCARLWAGVSAGSCS